MFFTDDNSIMVTNSNLGGLQTALNRTISDIISWCKANFLLLKFNKTYYLEFRTKNCIDSTLNINYFNKSIANVPYTNFLGLVIDDTLTRDNHIDHLISRTNSAYYAIRAVTAMLPRKALRILHFSYVHSVIFYGIIFWCNTPNNIKIFRIQKKKSIFIYNSRKMDSCREMFKAMEILPFYSQYIFLLLLYVVNNKHLFRRKWDVHSHDTRSANNFHLPITNLTKHLMQELNCNCHPTHIKSVANEIQVFKSALKRFLLSDSFYSIDEYFNSNK